MNCISCHNIGNSVLCGFCAKHATKGMHKRANSIWHELVVQSDQCWHCGRTFPRDMLCGDHLITKGSRPDLRYDIRVGVSCCKECNTSGSKYRKQPSEEFLSQFRP